MLWTSKRSKVFYPTKSRTRKRKKIKEERRLSRARPFRRELMLGIPNINEALSLGPNTSTNLLGSCPFTYKSWALAPVM